MRKPWLIAFACAACLAAPLARGQQRDTTRSGTAPPAAHRAMSPIGRAIAGLLQQASRAPAQASRSEHPGDAPPTGTAQPPQPQATAPAAAGEVALQPPI